MQTDFFRNIVESMQDGLWVTDKQHRIIYANGAMAAIAGVSVEQIVGHSVLDSFSEQTLRFFREHYLAAVNSLQAQKYRCQVVTPDGRLTWQAGWLTPLLEGDEFTGMLCTAEDVVKNAVNRTFQHQQGIPAARPESLHKDRLPALSSHPVADLSCDGESMFCLGLNFAELELAQRALHESQQMLRHLTDQLPGAVYQLRRFPDGRMAMPYASAGFYAMYELMPEEVREDISALGGRWHPDDAEGMRRAMAESARTLQPWINEYRVNLPSKGIEWRLSQARPEAEPDGSILWHGFITDITAKRQMEDALHDSEVKFRQKSQHLADVIWGTCSGTWEWNLLTGEVMFNECWAEIAGYQLSELGPLSIDTWRKLTHPDDLGESEKRLQRYFRQESKYYESETRIRHRNGKWIWVADRGRVVEWTAGGNPLRMSGIRVDTTARKLVESELKVAIAKAEQASNAKSRFLAAISHDLRQPLAALSLYVDVLKSKVAPIDRPLLKCMVNCVSSLSELLTDLLDISKLDAGVVCPEVSNFSVAELLDSQVSAHAPEALLKGLSLRYVPASLKARTDPVLFQRMLGDLIANAIRFTEDGGVLIGCRRRQGKTWIEVWDTGIGIPADKTAEIFEEFRQLNHDERNRGSGLGLAIVAKTAGLLGLQIRVQSRPGKGSMFALELPLSEEVTLAPAAELSSKVLRIALVDDNLSVLTAMVCALEVMGHEVVAATAGEDLLSRLGNQAPDAVIADFRLSEGQTGFDVIATLRATFGSMLPALIVTGDSDPQLMRSMADRGIVVQHKPVEFEALQACIAQIVKPG